MRKKTLITLVLFLSSCFSLLKAQNDNDERSLDIYYTMSSFGESVFIGEEEGIKSYIFYVDMMNDDQYRFFFYLIKRNAGFAVKKTWTNEFVQIEVTEQNFKLIEPKLRAAKSEVEELWNSSSNPKSEVERRMR